MTDWHQTWYTSEDSSWNWHRLNAIRTSITQGAFLVIRFRGHQFKSIGKLSNGWTDWHQTQSAGTEPSASIFNGVAVRLSVSRRPMVPQGGILSHIGDLSISLSNANAGCKFVNHFSYGDDMAILSPSASGLQKLVNICASYAIKHDIIYNVKKTQCTVVPSTTFKL